MDVSLPIRSVIPSLDGPVLAALVGTVRPVGLSEVQRLTGGRGSVAGVRKVLLRLVASGLVHSVPGGYVLNRDHIAAPAISELAQLHGELIARIRHVLEHWDGHVHVAGLFGSAARRDGDEQSDIDVLVVAESSDLDGLVETLAERIFAWTGNRAQVLGRTMDDVRRLRRAGEPIVEEWERDLIVIVGERRVLRATA